MHSPLRSPTLYIPTRQVCTLRTHPRHLSLPHVLRRHAAEPALEDLHAQQSRADDPEHETQRREADVRARGVAHRAPAEEQPREEHGERDEAREVEEGREAFEREVRVRMGACERKVWSAFVLLSCCFARLGLDLLRVLAGGCAEGSLPRGHRLGTLSRYKMARIVHTPVKMRKLNCDGDAVNVSVLYQCATVP